MAEAENISIPTRLRSALIKFVALDRKEMSSFITSLKKARPEISISALAHQLSAKNPTIDFDDLREILEMLASLYRYRDDFGASPKQIVEGVVSAAREETDRGRVPAIVVWARFKEDLRIAFDSSGSLAITAKASELSLENERTFCPASTRVLTDIRAVFSGNLSDAPSAAIIQHKLKIAYHAETGATDEFYVTLDGDDVEILMYHLIRAQEKEKSLRKLLKSTGIELIASDEDER